VLVPRTESSVWLQCIGEIRLQAVLDVLCRVDTLCKVHASKYTRSTYRSVGGRQGSRVVQDVMVWSHIDIDDDSRFVEMSVEG